jgi:GT2 family glycosyltransferase
VRGDVICLTDDDCAPAPGWAAALGAAAARGGVATGRTVTPPGAPAPARATQAIIDHLGEWAARPGSPSPGFAATCNLGVRSDLLRSHPFDDRFPAAAGEDREWSARLAAAGVERRPAPEAVVTHHIGGGIGAFARRQFRYGRGSARFRTKAGGRGPLAFYTGLLREGFDRGAGAGILVAAAQVIGAAGAGFEALRRAAGDRRDPRPQSR